MKTCIARLRSAEGSPYSQSRYHETPYLPNELPDAYEQRTWRQRLHVGPDGRVFIPPMAFKNALAEYAKFRSEKIQGKGNATWTKHFEAGVLVASPLVLDVRADDVEGEALFLNSDGKRGGGKRVKRYMPVIRQWEGDVTFLILDDVITEEVFTSHLDGAGKFIGIGRFRPRNNGFYGRFSVEIRQWSDLASAA